MNRLLSGTIIASLMLLASCTSTPSTQPGSGTWTFKGQTYTAVTFNNSNTRVAAFSASTAGASASILSVFFNTPALPASDGIYRVANYQHSVGPNDVSISVTTGGPNNAVTYWTTGGLDSATIKVSVLGSQITISGSAIEMSNPTSLSNPDSSAISFHIVTVN